MWICLNDAFFSIVRKDCRPDELLVRARRPGDIEKVFGRHFKVDKVDVADYLYRAVIPTRTVVYVLETEVRRITYGNFKDSVTTVDLHDAYMKVWSAMATVQPTAPYSGLRRQRSLFSDPIPAFHSEAPLPEFPEVEYEISSPSKDPIQFAYEANKKPVQTVSKKKGKGK